jgi:hypothetical protein
MKSWGDLIRDAKGDDGASGEDGSCRSKIPKSTRSMDGRSLQAFHIRWLKTNQKSLMALGIAMHIG